MPPRLANWDYGAPGAYFITACTHQRRPLFGKVEGKRVLLSSLGTLATSCVSRLCDPSRGSVLQAFVVMPDHMHLLIERHTSDPCAPPVDELVRGVKARLTHEARRAGLIVADVPLWQRGYFDRVVRTAEERTALLSYIETDPVRWTLRRGGGP